MRTIWVYKGTPGPPVEPSGLLNRAILYNGSRTELERRHDLGGAARSSSSIRASRAFLNRPYVERIMIAPRTKAPAEQTSR